MHPIVLGLALLGGIALGSWLRRQNPPGGLGRAPVMPIPAGEKTTVRPPCGGNLMIGPFAGRAMPGAWGGRANAQVLIHVKSACGQREAEIEVEQKRAGDYETLRERVGPGQEAKPQVGSWYVVPVPDRRHIKLTCPGGDGTCEFEVTDVPNQPQLDFAITANPLTPACGARAASRLINLSRDVVGVTVRFDSLCTDQHGVPQNGLIHKRPVRPTGVGPPTPVRDPVPMPALPDVPVRPAAPPAATIWRSALDGGYALEASCSGTHGGCSITVTAQR